MLLDETMPLWTIDSQPPLATAVSHRSSWVMAVCLHFYLLATCSWPFLVLHSSHAKVVSHQSSRVSFRFFSGVKACCHPSAVPTLCHHSTSEAATLLQKSSLAMTVAHPSILDCHHSTSMTLVSQHSLNRANIKKEYKLESSKQKN